MSLSAQCGMSDLFSVILFETSEIGKFKTEANSVINTQFLPELFRE